MKRRVKKAICAALLSVLMLSSYSMEIFAATPQETTAAEVEVMDAQVVSSTQLPEVVPYATVFADASITVSFSSAGMHITICTGMNGIASVVGVKNIVVERKTDWFGWQVGAGADGGEVYNATTAYCTMTYTGAVVGETYRVSCIHYGDVDGYRELESQTSGYECRY